MHRTILFKVVKLTKAFKMFRACLLCSMAIELNSKDGLQYYKKPRRNIRKRRLLVKQIPKHSSYVIVLIRGLSYAQTNRVVDGNAHA